MRFTRFLYKNDESIINFTRIKITVLNTARLNSLLDHCNRSESTHFSTCFDSASKLSLRNKLPVKIPSTDSIQK